MVRTCVDAALRLDDFGYELPEGLIAQSPPVRRDGARMMVVDRADGSIHHSAVVDLGDWLRPGDLLVANNSRVIPARLNARKRESGGRVEILLLRRGADGAWTGLAKPARRLRPGTRLLVSPRHAGDVPDAELEVIAVGGDGEVSVLFLGGEPARLEDYGAPPLPPYIRERLEDDDRYQTVYAAAPGSAAAPTAGLHFTPELLTRLREGGVGWAEVTLHVGLDTFRPVTVDSVADHRIHREWCHVPDETARRIAATRLAGGRVVAVGTTAARTLETLGGVWNPDEPGGLTTMTDLYILPGYRWTLVDALLTNFHLPRSTLLMMVSAFAGIETIRRAYAEAMAHGYRFFSFGDAMLIR